MGYKIDTTKLDRILAKLNGNADDVCRRAAFRILQEWDANAIEGETLALKNSAYVATQHEDNYDGVAAIVKTLNPNARTEAHPKPRGHIRAVVGPCVDYAVPVELGHLTKPFRKSYGAQNFVPGRPVLKPAAERVTKEFVDMWKRGLIKT